LREPNSGPPQLANAPLILPALGEMLVHPHWHGVALYAVLSLPLLLWHRRTRWLAAVVGALLLFYVGSYLTARAGADFWVRTSFARILVHGVPALLLGWGLAVPQSAEEAALESPLESPLESSLEDASGFAADAPSPPESDLPS
jgi:hypothetical protein